MGLLISLFFPLTLHARVGVGVATGKIVIEEELRPGGSYNIPPLTVINTGDEPSDYKVLITYHEGQSELKPNEDWLVFEPERFKLDPGKAQIVDIKLNLPVRAQPGNYFAYLEAQPDKKTENGGAFIGIAAATKLYFKVVPGGLVQGIYYKAASLWQSYSPWSVIITGGIVFGLIIIVIRKHLNISLTIGRKRNHTINGQQEDE